MKSLREDFDTWAKIEGFSVKRTSSGEYDSGQTQAYWKGWLHSYIKYRSNIDLGKMSHDSE